MAYKSRDYGAYARVLLESGGARPDVERIVAEARREDTEIEAGRCPKCGADIVRYGPEETAEIRADVGLPPSPGMVVPGAWVMYRCSTQKRPGVYDPDRPCDFGMDVYERDVN